MIACGALALAVSGGTGVGMVAVFFLVLVAAWFLERRKWQLSERVGLVVLVLSLPLFYLDWKYQSTVGYLDTEGRNQGGINALVHLTLFLSAVKLLQVKADRDWLFLYLISFFEVLLAAGLSISPLFIAALALYLFCALLTIVCFELRKARRNAPAGEAHLLVAHDAAWTKNPSKLRARGKSRALRRLPLAALCLLVLIFALALPIFFITPRFGANALSMMGGGATSYVGFSEQMTLGDIGRLQQNNQVVMRVRVDDPHAERHRGLRWRGVALDRFNGRSWTRSANESRMIFSDERELFQFGTTEHLNRLTTQTFFLEPIDTPVLFAAPRAVALQGSLPVVRRDAEGALSTRLHPQERLTYRAYSDTVEPPADSLRRDTQPYTTRDRQRYLQLTTTRDRRFDSLASQIVEEAGARNRYDKARAIEAYFNNNFGYSLEMRAGGDDPLADFLFRLKEGHCEYFSSAMVVLLRTQEVAARVVNGFQTGEYNDAADAYTVRQSDAHSWVEVYFPETDSWITFDPTPPAGRPGMSEATGLRAQLHKYTEALELFWIQYVVAYDRQEQRTLANSLRSHWAKQRDEAGRGAASLKASLTGWQGWRAALAASPMLVSTATLAATGVLAIALFVCARRFRRGWQGRQSRAHSGEERSVIEFYERMTKALASRGIVRGLDQTPLEFASATGVPEALTITRAYHRVRYGAERLKADEAAAIEDCLRRMEEEKKVMSQG